MSNPALLGQSVSTGEAFVGLILLVLAFALAALTGVFRPGNVVGPPRLGPRERTYTLWAIIGIGIFAMIGVSIAYSIVLLATTSEPLVPSQTRTLSDRDLIILSSLAGVAVLLAMLAGNVLLRRDGLRKLGLGGDWVVRAFLPAAIGAVIVLPLMNFVGYATEQLWQIIGLEHPNAHPFLRIFSEDGAVWLRSLVIFSAVVIAPVFEEVLFRGHLQTALVYFFGRLQRRPAPGFAVIVPNPDPSVPPAFPAIEPAEQPDPPPAPPPAFPVTIPGQLPEPPPLPIPEPDPLPDPNAGARWSGIIFASLIFAAFHGEIWMMPPIFVLALCLGYAYERTGNLWVPIMLHMTFNAFNVAFFVMQ